MIKPKEVIERANDTIFKTVVPVTLFDLQDREDLYNEFIEKRESYDSMPLNKKSKGMRTEHEIMCKDYVERIMGDYLEKNGFPKRWISVRYGPTKRITIEGPIFDFTGQKTFGLAPKLHIHTHDTLDAELDIWLERAGEDRTVESIIFALNYFSMDRKGDGLTAPQIVDSGNILHVGSTDFCDQVISAYGKLILNLDQALCKKAKMLHSYIREETEYSSPECIVSDSFRDEVLKPLWKEYEEKIKQEIDLAKFLTQF